jgi:hypothetical protein
MPQAVPEAVRRELVRRHQAGETLPAIAASLTLPFFTARGLWRRFRQRGEAAFRPDYARCAHPGPRGKPELHAQALALKRAHPSFGAGAIRLLLQEQFPDQRLPHPRTLQSWFQQAGLTVRRLLDEATGTALGAVTFPPGVGRGGPRPPDPGLVTHELCPLGTTGTAAGR